MKKLLLLLCASILLFSCSDSLATQSDGDETVDEDVETQHLASDEDETADEIIDEIIDEDETIDEIIDETIDEITDETVDETVDEDDLPSNELCTHLFGRPNENTGLDQNQCKPFFNCEGTEFVVPIYPEDLLTWMETRIYKNPPDEMSSNPYDNPENYPYYPNKACGLLWEDEKQEAYTLDTFDSPAAVEAAGAILTHSGACGHCSSLQSLSVYIKNNDLTGPVKSCTSTGIIVGEEKTMECLMNIGFDRICARAWYYNTKNTTAKCITKCIDDIIGKEYHTADGSLNDCIQCDEDESGPIFKTTSGRTRRNSGLPTALCRPCNTVTPITHWYRD